MKLIEIEKQLYRKRLNHIIICFVSSFAILSLVFGSLLITLFSEPNNDNFKLNLFGVIIALFICGGILNKYKTHSYFHEIYYVWQLKQLHNQIFRKLKKIKAAAQTNNIDAINILYFYYSSLRQVYLLDDNTLTISKVNQELNILAADARALNIPLSDQHFDSSIIKSF